MSVKRTKRRIDVDMTNGAGPEEKQAIRDIFNAQKIRTVLQRLVPLAVRDQNRQKGPKKPRGSRMPALDAWIRAALESSPEATVPDLWERFSAERGDALDVDLYMDGQRIVELVNGRDRETGQPGFESRVGNIRKELGISRR